MSDHILVLCARCVLRVPVSERRANSCSKGLAPPRAMAMTPHDPNMARHVRPASPMSRCSWLAPTTPTTHAQHGCVAIRVLVALGGWLAGGGCAPPHSVSSRSIRGDLSFRQFHHAAFAASLGAAPASAAPARDSAGGGAGGGTGSAPPARSTKLRSAARPLPPPLPWTQA